MPAPKYVDIMFGPYLPDFGGVPNPQIQGYLVDAVDVRWTPGGYRCNPTFSAIGNAVGTAGPVGSAHFSTTASSGTGEFLAIADTNKIYASTDTGSTWTDRTGTNTSVEAQFVDWYDDTVGENVVIMATTGLLQKRTVGAAANFANLTGTAYPTGGKPAGARAIARVRNHLVLGYINTGFDTGRYTVYWPAIGAINDWPLAGTADARAKESGIQELSSEFGSIVRIVGGEKFGIVVQERALTRMTYVGGSAVWEFDVYEKSRGGGSISTVSGAEYCPFVEIGPSQFVWINEQGAHVTDGYGVQTISAGHISEALFLDSINHPDGPIGQAARAAFDERRGQLLFKNNAGSGSDHHLVLNMHNRTFEIASGSTTHNVLFSGITSTTSQAKKVYSLGTDRKLYGRTGSPGSIAVQTGFMEIAPGYRIQLQGAHLLGTGVPGSLTLSYKIESDYDNLSTAQTGFTALTAAGRGNKATGRGEGQFVSFRITGTGAESQLIRGIRVYYEVTSPAD